jgi:hypothetical protein
VGSIEDDGGRLAIVAESVTDELKTSRFSFLVVPMSEYSGFRIAQDVPVGSESPGLIGIEVKLKRPTPVLSEISFPPTLARGSKGSVVSALQTALKRFDVPNSPTDPGPIDGDFGGVTDSAVRSYQAAAGLGADGIVGPMTMLLASSTTPSAMSQSTTTQWRKSPPRSEQRSNVQA